jgi:hypothetical protein
MFLGQYQNDRNGGGVSRAICTAMKRNGSRASSSRQPDYRLFLFHGTAKT